MACPGCGGDIRLISFITEPGSIQNIFTHLGELLKPPHVSPARGRRSTRGNWCSPMVMMSSSNHHRMICP